MIKWRASFYARPKIIMVEVDRETEMYVWIDGERIKKYKEFEAYWDSFDSAKNDLLGRCEKEVLYARSELSRANDNLGNVKGMKPQRGE